MDRRNFLRIAPIAAIAPKVVRDGVISVELHGPGHYLFVVDMEAVDVNAFAEYPVGLLPPGATGGYIIPVRGNPGEAIKIYKLDEQLATTDAEV